LTKLRKYSQFENVRQFSQTLSFIEIKYFVPFQVHFPSKVVVQAIKKRFISVCAGFAYHSFLDLIVSRFQVKLFNFFECIAFPIFKATRIEETNRSRENFKMRN